ncbi:MAG: methyltransferase domain-containing protein, partial [Rhodospirillales bacterium]|nr:methyltransferase domain-containing protein [Rhodospirillales bacterium]
ALAALPHAAASHWRLSLLLARRGDAAAAERHRRHALASSDHFPPPAVDGARKVMEALTGSGPVQVVMGGHWASHDGWLVLDQLDQDIGWPSLFHAASVDAVFCEHVIEHVPFAEAVGFLAELRRILKPGGCLRLLCPMVEKLMETQTDADAVRLYSGNSFSVFETERHLLRDRLRLGDLDRYFKTFQLNSMFRFWGHRFIWSAELLCDVLTALGFDRTAIVDIGQGTRPDLALERRARGLYTGNDWRADRALNHVFDPESLVIEAFC